MHAQPSLERPKLELELHLVRQVRPAVESRCRRTPMRRASTRLGASETWLKLECEQVTGSFKVRGPLALRSLLVDPRRWVTASAGNHGLGVAYALRGVTPSPLVFVPRTSPQVKREAIAGLGATIRIVDTTSYDEAEDTARSWAAAEDARFVSPFDDPAIMAGNGGTLGLEILEQQPQVASLVVPVGGGGLIAGIACVMRALRPRVHILGVQSEATPAMVESRQKRRALLRHTGPPTLAEGLEGGVSQQSFELVERWVDDLRLVPETSIAAAMRWLWREEGLRVEGSAAVGVAALLDGVRLPGPVCVVLTGRNVDDATWNRVLTATP